MKHILIMKEDIVQYPPILSMIRVLLELNKEVVFIGPYSDVLQKKQLENKGVVFYDKVSLNVKAKPLQKIKEQLTFRNYVKSVLYKIYNPDDKVLVINEDTVCLLWNVIKKTNYIIYFLETPGYNVRFKYRIYCPTFKLIDACKQAKKNICCEYNRAHIIKGLYQLDELPIVLPNKFYEGDSNDITNDIPEEIQAVIQNIKHITYGKKIVLYQGIFNSRERRLEEFILAVNSLPKEYVLVAMGRGDAHFHLLKEKYSSERIIFIDFIRPPYHLNVTKLAHIGILSYYPSNKSFTDILNPLYCAPNKIFEYTKFKLPMISNDLPALKGLFSEYKCGEILQYPISVTGIKDTILHISSNYSKYQEGASKYYNSVDIIQTINEIIN